MTCSWCVMWRQFDESLVGAQGPGSARLTTPFTLGAQVENVPLRLRPNILPE